MSLEISERRDSSQWDDIISGNIGETDSASLKITEDLEHIMLLHPDSRQSKTELAAYIEGLDAENLNIAVQWIKSNIDIFISGLKNSIMNGEITFDEEKYFSFLSAIRANVTLKYPLNEKLQKYLAESLLKMILELKVDKKIETKNLNVLSAWIELFISGFVNGLEMPQSITDQLKDLSDNDIGAKPLGKSGSNRIELYLVFPVPDPKIFPDIEPLKSAALDLLEEMKEKAYLILKNAGSMENYFYIKAETHVPEDLNGKYARIWEWSSPGLELFALLNIEKRKLKELLARAEEIMTILEKLLTENKTNGQTDIEKPLNEYREQLEQHIKSIWEDAILPHLLFYAQLIHGKRRNNSGEWI